MGGHHGPGSIVILTAQYFARADQLSCYVCTLSRIKGAVQVQKVRSGVRALPPRSSEGAVPLAGRLDGRVWIVLGLGARGLVYHAWLGKLLSQAILAGDDALLPEELLRWKARTKA